MCVSTEWIKHTLLQRAVSWPEGGRVRLQAAGREWLRELDGSAEEKMDVLRSHRVIQISIHLIVQLVNGVDSRGEVEEEFSDFLQALLVLDLPTFGEGPQEIWLIWSGEKSRLKEAKRHIYTQLKGFHMNALETDAELTLKSCCTHQPWYFFRAIS